MGFSFRKVKCKVKGGRGSANAEAVLESLLASWNQWNDAVQEMEDKEKAEFTEAFNDIVEDSGDVLTGGDKDELE